MENKITNAYRQLLSINKVAKLLHVSTIRVSNVLYANNLGNPRKGGGRQSVYTISNGFFKNIDTENKAYILGFIYADGNISTSKNSISICLKRTDREILEKIKKCMNSNYPLYETTGQYSIEYPVTEKVLFSVSSKELKEDLINIGCIPKKSDILSFPDIDDSLVHHFMRGYFDGDGTVFIENQNGNIRTGIISTYEFCKIFLDKLNLSENIAIHKEKRTNKNVHYFTIAKLEQVKATYDFLYKDATIFLERKKEKFDNWFMENVHRL